MAIESLAALTEAGKHEDLFDVIVRSDCVDRGVTNSPTRLSYYYYG